MATIDVGLAATDRGTTLSNGYTVLAQDNVANDSGTISSIEIWCNSELSNVKAGVFYDDGSPDYTVRDFETIGTVSSGSKQTFSGLDIDVVAGDLIGYVCTAGNIEADDDQGGIWYYAGDGFTDTRTYTDNPTPYGMSLYGEGATPGGGGAKSLAIVA